MRPDPRVWGPAVPGLRAQSQHVGIVGDSTGPISVLRWQGLVRRGQCRVPGPDPGTQRWVGLAQGMSWHMGALEPILACGANVEGGREGGSHGHAEPYLGMQAGQRQHRAHI